MLLEPGTPCVMDILLTDCAVNVSLKSRDDETKVYLEENSLLKCLVQRCISKLG